LILAVRERTVSPRDLQVRKLRYCSMQFGMAAGEDNSETQGVGRIVRGTTYLRICNLVADGGTNGAAGQTARPKCKIHTPFPTRQAAIAMDPKHMTEVAWGGLDTIRYSRRTSSRSTRVTISLYKVSKSSVEKPSFTDCAPSPFGSKTGPCSHSHQNVTDVDPNPSPLRSQGTVVSA
jgi:hypothetical protein